MNHIVLRLPYPPSVNTYWRHVGTRTLISRAGREYVQSVEDRLFCSGFKTGFGKSPLAVAISLSPPDARRRDIDNVLKALLDAMGKANVYTDDSQIARLFVERSGTRPQGGAVVAIYRQDTIASPVHFDAVTQLFASSPQEAP